MIKIAHLYPDELNLYGENGNLKALKYSLENKGYKVEIIKIGKYDSLNFKNYDFIYIGSGRNKYLQLIKERLKIYKEEILHYLNMNKPFLVTGNALGIFDFLNLYTIEYFKERKVADVEATSALVPGIIKGFQNTEYLIKSTNNVLFNIEKGYGNNRTYLEGYNYHNLYVTSLIGPLLARNELLADYFAEEIIANL